MSNESMTFRQAYGVLQEHAETLRNQTEPNIDDLLRIVDESVAAYKVCKERIDAVEKALQKALTDVATDTVPRSSGADDAGGRPGTARTRGTAAAPKPSSGFDDMDDDTPF